MPKFCPVNYLRISIGCTSKKLKRETPKLEAIGMAIEMAINRAANYPGCIIYADNQAAIKSIWNPKRQSGQISIFKILRNFVFIHRNNPSFKTSHKGIPGNEKADKEAKLAATEVPPAHATLAH